MARAIAVMLLVLASPTAVPAKVLCPPGRFTIRTTGGASAGAFDGMELVLGEGTATLTGMCRRAPARRFHPSTGDWGFEVRTKWRRCQGASLAMRARWDFDATWCTRLAGKIWTASGRRVRFAADRIQECGNGVREAGEQCDGRAGTLFGAPCCEEDTCRVKPECLVLCDTTFPCEGDGEICEMTCTSGGICRDRATVDCGPSPVCGCDLRTTYADRCAAWAAGTGVARPGPCPVN